MSQQALSIYFEDGMKKRNENVLPVAQSSLDRSQAEILYQERDVCVFWRQGTRKFRILSGIYYVKSNIGMGGSLC